MCGASRHHLPHALERRAQPGGRSASPSRPFPMSQLPIAGGGISAIGSGVSHCFLRSAQVLDQRGLTRSAANSVYRMMCIFLLAGPNAFFM
jgi:hypothetical protein